MRVLCYSVVALALGAAVGCASTTELCHASRDCDASAYCDAIVEMLRTDQLHRSAISWGTTDKAELDRLSSLPDNEQMVEYARRTRAGIRLDAEVEKALWEKQIAIDRANGDELMAWVRACGWPTRELLGEDAPSVIPILIHMPMDQAAWVLPVLKKEVLAGRMPPKPYATIYDRKQQHDGTPQLYGMVQAFDAQTRTVLSPAIVDLDATNRARAEIGLDPIGEHRITDEQTAAGR